LGLKRENKPKKLSSTGRWDEVREGGGVGLGREVPTCGKKKGSLEEKDSYKTKF